MFLVEIESRFFDFQDGTGRIAINTGMLATSAEDSRMALMDKNGVFSVMAGG